MALGGNPVFNSKTFRSQTSGATAWADQAQANQSQLSARQLEEMYKKPAAGPLQTGRLSYDDVIMKTIACLAVVLVGAGIGWFIPVLMLPGALIGLVLGLVNAFKREPVPGLILAYAAAEGLFVGGLSGLLDSMYPGVAVQAVLGTLCVFAVTLLLFRSGKVRATPKAMKFFLIAMVGYALFSLVNFGLTMFNVVESPWGVRGMDIPGTSIPWGAAIGLLAIGLAAFSLIVDFTSIQEAVRAGAPRKFAWTAAFGLTVTLVWLYVELLRLLAILRGDE